MPSLVNRQPVRHAMDRRFPPVRRRRPYSNQYNQSTETNTDQFSVLWIHNQCGASAVIYAGKMSVVALIRHA